MEEIPPAKLGMGLWNKDQARSGKGIFTDGLKVYPWCNMSYKSYLLVSYSINAHSNKNLQRIASYNNTS